MIKRDEASVKESSGSIEREGRARARAVEERLKCLIGAVKSGTMSGTDSNYANLAIMDEAKMPRNYQLWIV